MEKTNTPNPKLIAFELSIKINCTLGQATIGKGNSDVYTV